MDELRDPDSSPMEDLLAEALARLEDEGSGALDALCAEHPELAAGLRQRVAWLLGTGLARPEPGAGFRHPERLGDFELLEPLGQGGMGMVFRAQQRSLGRQVALKLVRPEQLYFPEARARFQREVTTVAALAHPGIVPVYAVGEEGGLPYCAMELVHGGSLSGVIGRLFGREPRSLDGADLVAALDALGADPAEQASQLFAGPWPKVCARIAREVAEALEHAHRRGVVHRDVKPSNVMVTRGGRVMLVDFGLSSSAASDERTTRTGAQVGTLAYMSPEQLRGEADVDARADVFALGVTLFELLTLRLPFGAQGPRAASGAEVAGAPALRRYDPRIAWELETVVQTAMEPEPGRRYASAQDLADDLTRVLEGRPIEARRSSAWLRARRWVRRHPATAFSIAALVLAPSLLAWQQHRSGRAIAGKNAEVALANAELGRANAELGDALAAAQRERDAAQAARERAERAFDRSAEAIELMLGRVGGEALEDVPGVEPLRRELLGEALRLHAELLAEPVADARQRALHAATLRRSAAIHALLGDYPAALEALAAEAALLDELIATAPDDEAELKRAQLELRRAELAKLTGGFAAAEAHAREAIARLLELEARAADPGPAAWDLARARMELADVLVRAGRPDERGEPLRLALEGLRRSGVAARGSQRERREVARALQLLGAPPTLVAAMEAPHLPPDESLGFLELSESLRRELVAEQPSDPSARRALAETLISQSVFVASARDFEGAYARLEEAAALYARLREEYPTRPVYADGLAAASLNLGQLAALLERDAERERWLEGAVSGFESLVELVPDSAPYRRNLGLALGQLGQVEIARDPARAALRLARSLELLVPLWRAAPTDRNLRLAIGWTHSRLAEAHRARGDARAIAAVAERLLELDPPPIELAYAAQILARAVAAAPAAAVDEAQAEAWRAQAFELLAAALEAAPEDSAVRAEVASPELAALAGDPRYRELIEFFGLGG
jgi:serine/threonine protein kinase/tetratricopeptide (TPR) repeat protein